MRRRRDGQAGLTLVELMITILVASLLMAATFAFFAGQQQIYDVHSKLLNLQQNLWASVDTLSRYVRSAGGGMLQCVRADPDGAGPAVGDPPPGGQTPPQTGLRAYLNGTGAIRIAPIWIKNGLNGAPDTLTVAFGTGASGTFSDAPLNSPTVSQSTDPITTLAGQAARFLSGEFILLVDNSQSNGDRGCSLFQVTGTDAPTNTTLFHTAAGSNWNTAANVAGVIPATWSYKAPTNGGTSAIRLFGQLTWVQFAIDSTGAPAQPPRLTMNRLDGNRGPEVLAEGIEDMQIAYACDLAPAGVPDGVLTEGTDAASRLTDEWTYNQAGDVEQAGCNVPAAVRITLIGRSLTPDMTLQGGAPNAKPAAEDGAAGTPDLYRHRVETVSIYPRNCASSAGGC